MRNLLIFLLPILVLSGCLDMPSKPQTNAEARSTDGRPAWLDNPGNGAVGFAGDNVFGPVKQDETATLRARDEFARRYGVALSSTQNSSTAVANGHVVVTGDSTVHQETNQTNVQCVVKEKWLDTKNNMLWVWVVPAK